MTSVVVLGAGHAGEVFRIELPTRDEGASDDATDRVELSREEAVTLMLQLQAALGYHQVAPFAWVGDR